MSSAKVTLFLAGLLEFLGLDIGVSRIGLTLLMTRVSFVTLGRRRTS